MSSLLDAPRAMSDAPEAQALSMRSYRMPAKVLHWLTAVLVLSMILCGVVAKQLGEGPLADTLMNWHKLTGALTLGVVIVRVLYRLFRAMPEWGMNRHRRPVLHWIMYGVVLMVPLLGWAGISDFGAREVAGGIVLPAIWPEGAGYDSILFRAHAYAAFGLLALVALHVGIAIQDTLTAERPAGTGETER